MSCPCALVISTPVTIAAAITSAARHGALIKGGVHLEGLARLRVVALDKTGVVTRGEPDVRVIRPLGGRTESEVLSHLLAVEMQSEHPLSRAVVRYARERGVEPAAVADFRAVEGRGAEAVVTATRSGSARALRPREDGARPAAAEMADMQRAGETVVVCGAGDDVWAIIAITDQVRAEARESVSQLHALGLRSALLTATTARPPATSRGAWACPTSARSCCRRQGGGRPGPVRALRRNRHGRRRHQRQQALLAAQVGIALGGNATDVAVESADVVRLQADMRRIPFLVGHARRARSLIIENVALALGSKALFLAFMLFGAATLWMAVAADMGATLLVTSRPADAAPAARAGWTVP